MVYIINGIGWYIPTTLLTYSVVYSIVFKYSCHKLCTTNRFFTIDIKTTTI